MRYFKSASARWPRFKINGYSPYMEQVSPTRRTRTWLSERAARRRNCASSPPTRASITSTLVPQQQTLAHMHEALK